MGEGYNYGVRARKERRAVRERSHRARPCGNSWTCKFFHVAEERERGKKVVERDAQLLIFATSIQSPVLGQSNLILFGFSPSAIVGQGWGQVPSFY